MSTYQIFLEKYAEFGIVEEVHYPVVLVAGLPTAYVQEFVIFDDDKKGQIISLRKDLVEVLLFSKSPVKKGQKVARTGKTLSIPVGDYLLGKVIDPLGNLKTTGEGKLFPDEEREIDIAPQNILHRKIITEPCRTGVSLVDLLIPLGKGQRELIVGDRKTGKSSFCLSVVKQQILEGSIAVVAVIGKQMSEIERYRMFFEKEGISDKVVFIVSSAIDSQTLIYLTPFTAMTVAEYFRDKGHDVILILDDLSSHAKYYREIALLGNRFPGRDSYPGDIFYTHARLLERAGNFSHSEVGEVSITCLPLAETIENDLSDYIVSNLISITDGHVLFDQSEYAKGRRPAVNHELSVTRVGKQTRNALQQSLNVKLVEFLLQYKKSESFSHFGSELNDEVLNILRRGEIFYQLFYQPVNISIPEPLQIFFSSLVFLDFFKDLDKDSLLIVEDRLFTLYKNDSNFQNLVNQVINTVSIKSMFSLILNEKEKIISYMKVN